MECAEDGYEFYEGYSYWYPNADNYYDYGADDEIVGSIKITRDGEFLEDVKDEESFKLQESESSIVTPIEEEESEDIKSEDSDYYYAIRETLTDKLKLLEETNIFDLYPVPDDPGLYSALHSIQPRRKSYADDGLEIFQDTVQSQGLMSMNKMKKMLFSDAIDLSNYCVDPRVVRAICDALMNNRKVEMIDLKNSWLSLDACFHLNQLLLESASLKVLRLSGCQIGLEGAKRLQDGIFRSLILEELDVSSCGLEDEGFSFIAEAVSLASALHTLNLRNNSLGEASAKPLESMLLQVECLANLDLSWNNLYTEEFWEVVIVGLLKNKTLCSLNLSWNSLGNECLKQLASYMAKSTNIVKLNLSSNNFTREETPELAKALSKSQSLIVVNLSGNPLKTLGVQNILEALAKAPIGHNTLADLILDNVSMTREILPSMEALAIHNPNINVAYEIVNFELEEPNAPLLLFRRALYEGMKPKRKKLRKNFGKFVLSLPEDTVPIADYLTLLRKFKIKLSKSLKEEIAKYFPGETPKTVDLAALRATYFQEFPDPNVPIEKQKNKVKPITARVQISERRVEQQQPPAAAAAKSEPPRKEEESKPQLKPIQEHHQSSSPEETETEFTEPEDTDYSESEYYNDTDEEEQ